MAWARRDLGWGVGLVCLVTCLGGSSARAADPTCVADGVALFPVPGSVVPVNVQWLLEGEGAEQARVSELVGNDAVALIERDGSTAVQVKVEKGWVSQVKRVAVRLKPARALKPDTTYTLAFGKALAGAHLLNDTLGDGTLQWTTGPGPDKDAPRYRSKPAVAEGRYVPGDPDPVLRQLRLRLEVEDKSSTYLLITLQRMRGSTLKQQYPVPVDGDSALMGHDGCSGTFGWEDGRAYRLQFELFDSAGNRNSERLSLEVSAPRPSKAQLQQRDQEREQQQAR
jgi:hypothetical protein